MVRRKGSHSMRSAIKFHPEGLRKKGAEILEPSTKVKYIEISV